MQEKILILDFGSQLFFLILVIAIATSCQPKSKNQSSTTKKNINQLKTNDNQSLKIGNEVELSGGYDYDPLYLRSPRSERRRGKVFKFIKGQNEDLAAVVKIDQVIQGDKIKGDILVLELRYEDQTWATPSPVHIELCDSMPEDKSWKDRKKGEWVEAAATVTILP